MLGNKNQRSQGYNQSSIHSYLQPYHQQQQSSSNQQQSQLNQYLQQRENNRGSLQKALSPARCSTQKPVAILKQNQKVQSQNNFKEENSISNKLGGSSSLLKNSNANFGGGIIDNNKQKIDSTLSPCVKNSNIQRNSLLSSQQIKQSTQNLTYLLTKGKESKSVEQKCLNNYSKEVQEKQNQKGIDDGCSNEIYLTPQSKINQSVVNGQQSAQQYQQQAINGNLSNSQYNTINNQLQISQSSLNQGTFTPSNSGNNICTINLSDKLDIQKNSNQTNQINTTNIQINGNMLTNNQRYQANSPHGSNRLVLQSNGSPHSSTSALKSNLASNVNNQKNNYFGQMRNSSQLSHSNATKSNGHQQSSADNKAINQKTKYIDLAQSNTGLKKQTSQPSQTSIQNIHLTYNNRYDSSPALQNNFQNNSSSVNSKNQLNGAGNNQQQYHSNSINNGRDSNNKKQNQTVNSNKQITQQTTNNSNQKTISDTQKIIVSLPSQNIEKRTIDSTGNVNGQVQSEYNQKSTTSSPNKNSKNQINILHECNANSNNMCFNCKNNVAKYFIITSNQIHIYLCYQCGVDYTQKQYPSHLIASNSISTGIEGSTAESYLSPVKSPLPLQTIDLRSPEQSNQSPNIYQFNLADIKNPKEDPLQFQSFHSNQSYINQMVPIENKFKESETQSIPQQSIQSSKISNEIEGIIQNKCDKNVLKENSHLRKNSQQQNFEKSQTINSNNSQLLNNLNQINYTPQNQQHLMVTQPTQKISELNVQQIDHLSRKDDLQNNNIYDIQGIYPISQALKEFQQQIGQEFPNQVNESQKNNNNVHQINSEAKNITFNQNTQQLSNDYNEYLQKQQPLQYNQVSSPLSIDYMPQLSSQLTSNNFDGQMSEEEKIKRQKLNNFQNRLLKIKGDFENLLKLLTDKNDTSIQEYHKNVEYIENIQKYIIGAIHEITSKQKEQLLNNFNENLSKCKDNKFEIQQILNYLNCTENDLMSNLDSIIKDMDFESLDDIISQYSQIITQYEDARTKKFLNINFTVYQMKYQNDPSQLNICCSKVQEGIQHLLTAINYSQNIQRNQINTNVQQNFVTQNSFLIQQPKSIYVSFENRDIFQSAAQSTPEHHHPETQPQSPSFQSTLSLHAQNQNQQSPSSNAQQFLTFKDIIMNEEQNQKFQQQVHQSIQLTESQQSFQAYPYQPENNQIQGQNLYPNKIDIIQKSSFGGDYIEEFPDSPVTQQQKNQNSTYYQTLNDTLKMQQMNEKEGEQNLGLKSQISGSFKDYIPIQISQKQASTSINIHDLNQNSIQTDKQNMPLQTVLDNFPSIDSKKQINEQNVQNIPNSQLYTDTNGKFKRKNMSVEQNQFDKSKKYNSVGISLINPSNTHDNHEKIKSEDYKVSYQKRISGDEYGMNGNSLNYQNKLLIRSEDNLFGKIKNQNQNYYEIVSPVSNTSQNYHGGYSQNQSDDFLFNQSTATTFSNTNNSQHQHNLSIKNKQKYNDLLQKIQVNQSQTEKLCTDVLSSGANFKFSQIEENIPLNGNHKPAQLSLSKK